MPSVTTFCPWVSLWEPQGVLAWILCVWHEHLCSLAALVFLFASLANTQHRIIHIPVYAMLISPCCHAKIFPPQPMHHGKMTERKNLGVLSTYPEPSTVLFT